MATDLPDWTQQVQIEAGKITATIVGPVTVAGTVNVGTVGVVSSISDPVTVGSVTDPISIASDQTVNVSNVPTGHLTVAGTIDIGNTPSVTISGTPNVAIASGSVGISGSVTVQKITDATAVINETGTVLQTGNEIVQIASYTFSSTSSPEISIAAATASLAYSAFMVVIYRTSGSGVPACASVTPTWSTLISGAIGRFIAPFGKVGYATTRWQVIIPAATLKGYESHITAWMSAAMTGQMRIYGMTFNPGVTIRPDGRACPIGAYGVSGITSTTSGTHTVLAAPASPFRTMIYSATIMASVPTTGTNRALLVSTGVGVLTEGQSTVTNCYSETIVYNSGLLLKEGASLVLGMYSSVQCVASVTYDLYL